MESIVSNLTGSHSELDISLNESTLRRVLGDDQAIEKFDLKIELAPQATEVVKALRKQATEAAPDAWLQSVQRGEIPFEKSERSSWGSSDSEEARALGRILNSIDDQKRTEFIKNATEALLVTPAALICTSAELFAKLMASAQYHRIPIEEATKQAFRAKLLKEIFSESQAFKADAAINLLREGLKSLYNEKNLDSLDNDFKLLCAILKRDSESSMTLSAQVDFAHRHQIESGSSALSGALISKGLALLTQSDARPLCDQFVSTVLRKESLRLIQMPEGYKKSNAMEAVVKMLRSASEEGLNIDVASWSVPERTALIESCLQVGEVATIVSLIGKDSQELKQRALASVEKALDKELDLVLLDNVAKSLGLANQELLTQELLQQWDLEIDALVSRGEIEKAAELWIKHAAAKHFFDTGTLVTSVASTMNLPAGYYGKVMLLEVSDGNIQRLVVRGFYEHLVSRSEFHSDIVHGFERELGQRGLQRLKVNKLGGAHIEIPRENSEAIILKGRSEDFGECHKATAKEILQKAFPDREIVIQKN